jgi:uncharacterized protein with HEPN domain
MSPDSTRDWRLYADDIIEACGKIRRYTAGMTFDAFVADDRTCDAVIRNIEIIGEAAKKLPDEVIAKAPAVPWRKVRGMRDVVAHGYFGLDKQARLGHGHDEDRRNRDRRPRIDRDRLIPSSTPVSSPLSPQRGL